MTSLGHQICRTEVGVLPLQQPIHVLHESLHLLLADAAITVDVEQPEDLLENVRRVPASHDGVDHLQVVRRGFRKFDVQWKITFSSNITMILEKK